MIAFVKRLWAAAPFATALLALALAAVLLFGVRSALFWAHRHDRIDREQPVAAWMTPGYVAHSWAVPREVILEAVDAPVPPPRGPMNFNELAELNGTTPEALIAATEAAIAAWRAANPTAEGQGDRRGDVPPPGDARREEPAPAPGDGEADE